MMKSHVLLCLMLIGIPNSAFAGLGDKESAIDSDAKAMGATHNTTSTPSGLRFHELKTSTLTVKEFVGTDGTVFAVTWRGNRPPELSQVLSTYYDEFRMAEATQTRGPGRRSSLVQTSKVVVSRGGHMRDIHGTAYLPDHLPPGVKVGDL